MLRPVREKELSKILLEVLSLIAYRQPITRGEIEDSRGASADYALGVLLKIDMIKTCGYKELRALCTNLRFERYSYYKRQACA